MDAPVQLRGVTLRHPRSFGPHFEDLTLEFGVGLTTVLGEDGAGKSTLLAGITGLLKPRRGTIEVLRQKPAGRHRAEVMRRLGYLPQGFGFLPRLTVPELVAQGAWLKGIPREFTTVAVERAIERCGLGAWTSAVIGQAAPWVQHRAGIAQQIVHDPAVLLLDEPTAGLSPEQRAALHGVLEKLAADRAVVVTTRLLEDVDPEGMLVLLHAGKVRYRGPARDFDAAAHRAWLGAPVPEPEADAPGAKAVDVETDAPAAALEGAAPDAAEVEASPDAPPVDAEESRS